MYSYNQLEEFCKRFSPKNEKSNLKILRVNVKKQTITLLLNNYYEIVLSFDQFRMLYGINLLDFPLPNKNKTNIAGVEFVI